jgi:hypothetical protein
LKIISVRDNPELRDLMASNWLRMQAANSAAATDVPDNAPQNPMRPSRWTARSSRHFTTAALWR